MNRFYTRCLLRKYIAKIKIIAVFTLALIVILNSACFAASQPGIKDIVVCNVYWENYKYVHLPGPRLSKFVVTFQANHSPDPSAMESLSVEGPGNYAHTINITPYSQSNLNGYIETPGSIWFMAFDRSGFLKNGTYTITLKYRDSKVSTKSRVLNYTGDILDAYLRTRKSFSPSNRLDSTIPLDRVILKWTVLEGLEAYYMTRLGEYPLRKSTRTSSNWLFQDTVFGYGTGNPHNTGLNKGQVLVNKTLQPNTGYLWFTEILDSNDFNRINIAIFQFYQYFKTGE